MNESNYKMYNILENYSSHNDIKIHSRMHPKSYKFSWKSIPSNPLAMKLKIIIRTHDNAIAIQYLPSISKNILPCITTRIFRVFFTFDKSFIQAHHLPITMTIYHASVPTREIFPLHHWLNIYSITLGLFYQIFKNN